MTARFTLSGESVRTVIEFEGGQFSGTGGGFPRIGASNPARIEASDLIVTVFIPFQAIRSSKTHEEFRFAIFNRFSGSRPKVRQNRRKTLLRRIDVEICRNFQPTEFRTRF
jgi:hypothetical protein